MNDAEFNRVVILVSERLMAAFECEPPPPTMAARRVSRVITSEHVIKTQAEIINQECTKVDSLRRRNKVLHAECMRLRKTCGWLRETQRPIGRV